MSIVLKNTIGEEYYHAAYVAEGHFIESNWIGFISIEELKAAANAALTLFERHRTSCLLNDNSRLEGSWDEANEWIAQDWMPRAIGLGLQRFAHVVSPDIFGAMSAEDLVSRAAGFEMRIFESREAAQTWLLEKQPVKVG